MASFLFSALEKRPHSDINGANVCIKGAQVLSEILDSDQKFQGHLATCYTIG